MDQGRGLWDLLFGVNDPDAAIKMEACQDDTTTLNLNLSGDLMSLLVGSSTGGMQCLDGSELTGSASFIDDCISSSVEHMDTVGSSRDSASSPGSATLHTVDSDQLLSDDLEFDAETLSALTEYLQNPEALVSSNSSGSSSDDGSSDNGSCQGSPKSTHSKTATSHPDKMELTLTPEELTLLRKEGLSLPKCYPLSKQDERTLKKIRRKIRNKKSAQESRRKRKVYMDQLEEQVKDVTAQNKTLHKRVKDLERENASLQSQLKTLQTVLGRATRNTKATGTCLMALVLSVALIMTPYNNDSHNTSPDAKQTMTIGDYEVENVTPVRSRILYNLEGPPEPVARFVSQVIPLGKPVAFPAAVVAKRDGQQLVVQDLDERGGQRASNSNLAEMPPTLTVHLNTRKSPVVASR
ncbi:hypothetical protein RvY_06156 [Ramazzottius varieornatus]|uniref:BZIP domain-containing protein n=1 Tax=Ramazzottius varieornatus TaxID=947166 RepID=A0A1D1V6D3_RAMVA|nr:hypothetical protein RvY_06156 [Ramazzottius varieornatus]